MTMTMTMTMTNDSSESTSMRGGYILNCTFPNRVDELRSYFLESGSAWCMERLCDSRGGHIGSWSSHSAAKVDDVCFLMCSLSSKRRSRSMLNSMSFAINGKDELFLAVRRSAAFCHDNAGKILAVAKVVSEPSVMEDDGLLHWTNRYYAELGSAKVLENPVSIKKLGLPIKINTFGGITTLSNDMVNALLAECGISEL